MLTFFLRLVLVSIVRAELIAFSGMKITQIKPIVNSFFCKKGYPD